MARKSLGLQRYTADQNSNKSRGYFLCSRFTWVSRGTTHGEANDKCINRDTPKTVYSILGVVIEKSPQYRDLHALLFANSVWPWVLLRHTELWSLKGCDHMSQTGYALMEYKTNSHLTFSKQMPLKFIVSQSLRAVSIPYLSWRTYNPGYGCWKARKGE